MSSPWIDRLRQRWWRARPGTRQVAGAVLGISVVVLIWAVVSWLQIMEPRFLPPPWEVLDVFVADARGDLWRHLVATLTGTLWGLLVGVLSGTVVGLLLFRFPRSYAVVRPYLSFLNATPRVVLAPFFILILGIGTMSSVALSVSLVAIVVVYGVHNGVLSVEPHYLRSTRTMGATELQVWRHVLIPGALPYFLSTLRVSVSLALLGVVIGEILVSQQGIGWLLRNRGQAFDVAGSFSALLALGFLATFSGFLIDRMRERILTWQ